MPNPPERSRLTRLAGELLAADIAPGALQIARDSAAGELASACSIAVGTCGVRQTLVGNSISGPAEG